MSNFTDLDSRRHGGFFQPNISDDACAAEAELTGVDDADCAEALLELQVHEMVLLSVLDDMPPALPPSLTTFLR